MHTGHCTVNMLISEAYGIAIHHNNAIKRISRKNVVKQFTVVANVIVRDVSVCLSLFVLPGCVSDYRGRPRPAYC